MSTRVFVLLELVNVDSSRVARILRIKPGVAMVNLLEGPPDLILAIEAPERLKAGEYLMDVLDSVNGMTENLRILPVCESVEERERAIISLDGICRDYQRPVLGAAGMNWSKLGVNDPWEIGNCNKFEKEEVQP